MGVCALGTKVFLADGGNGLQIVEVLLNCSDSNESCGCQSDTTVPTGCISGKAVDIADMPLVGTMVVLNRTIPSKPKVKKTVKTDSNGCYHFSDLKDGVYKVKLKTCKKGGTKKVMLNKGKQINDINFTCP